MGRKNCAVIMLTSACLVLTACAPTEFPEQNGTENQDRMESFVEQELAEFGKDDIEKIPDHLTYQVDDLLTVDADIRLWGLSEWKLSDWYATEKNYTESEEEANRLIKERTDYISRSKCCTGKDCRKHTDEKCRNSGI